LKDTVRAINRAVDDEIDDVIAATDPMMGTGTAFYKPALPSGDQKAVLSLTEGILERTEQTSSLLDAVYHSYGNPPRFAQNSLCHGVSHNPSVQENPSQLIYCHEFHISLIGGFSTFLRSLTKPLPTAQKYGR